MEIIDFEENNMPKTSFFYTTIKPWKVSSLSSADNLERNQSSFAYSYSVL